MNIPILVLCTLPDINRAVYLDGLVTGDIIAHNDSVGYECVNGTSTESGSTRGSFGATHCFDGEWSLDPVDCQGKLDMNRQEIDK